MKVLLIIVLIVISVALTAQDADEQFKAADQSLMIMPTAYTMPKGASTFTDYEVFIVQYAYGLTDRTHLSIGMPFPIVTEAFEYSALGIKQNYLKYNKLQLAASLTWMPKAKGGAISNIISYGTPKSSVHGLVSFAYDYDELKNGALLALGGIINASKRADLMAEILTLSEVADEEGGQLITMGVRIKGDRMSWDLGGFRPLTGDAGTLILFPFIKLTVLF